MTKKTVFYEVWALPAMTSAKTPCVNSRRMYLTPTALMYRKRGPDEKKGTDTASVPFCIYHKNKELKNISNFPPIIVYTIFVQIAIGKPKKFVYFSAKLLSIFLTIYWKSVFRSVIMDYANMIYVMQTRHQFGR